MRGRSRYYDFSIMGNSSFGDLTIIQDKYKFIVPKKYITLEGKVYDRISTLIEKRDLEKLSLKGILVLEN